MGYPMNYSRVVSRNHLAGDYCSEPRHIVQIPANMVAGDLRRLETDQRDKVHLAIYAKKAGITEEQAKKVLDHFFEENWW